jgi:hypothetical protein
MIRFLVTRDLREIVIIPFSKNIVLHLFLLKFLLQKICSLYCYNLLDKGLELSKYEVTIQHRLECKYQNKSSRTRQHFVRQSTEVCREK